MRTTAFVLAAAILELIVGGPALAQDQGKPGEVAPLESAGQARGAVEGVREGGTQPVQLPIRDAGDRDPLRVPGSRAADRNDAPGGNENRAAGGAGVRRDAARGDLNLSAGSPLRRGPGITPSISGPAASSGHGLAGARQHGAASPGIDLVTPDGGYGTPHRRATGNSLMVHTEKRRLPFVGQKYGAHSPGMPPRIVKPSRNAIGALPTRDAAAQVSPLRRPGVGGYVPLVPKDEGTPAGPAPGTTALGGLAHGGNDENRLGDVRPFPVHPVIPVNPSSSMAGINGTAIGRTAARSGMIGGPAKDRSAINGTVIRPRF